MNKFYKHRLRMEKNYTHILVPEDHMCLFSFFENNHIYYEVDYPWEVHGVRIDEKWPGLEANGDAVIVKTKCNARDLMEIAKETYDLSTCDIGDEYDPVEARTPSDEEYLNSLRNGGYTEVEIEEEKKLLKVRRDEETTELKKKGLSDSEIDNFFEKRESERIAGNEKQDKTRHFELYRTIFED